MFYFTFFIRKEINTKQSRKSARIYAHLHQSAYQMDASYQIQLLCTIRAAGRNNVHKVVLKRPAVGHQVGVLL